jgi:hypothetical protein
LKTKEKNISQAGEIFLFRPSLSSPVLPEIGSNSSAQPSSQLTSDANSVPSSRPSTRKTTKRTMSMAFTHDVQSLAAHRNGSLRRRHGQQSRRRRRRRQHHSAEIWAGRLTVKKKTESSEDNQRRVKCQQS